MNNKETLEYKQLIATESMPVRHDIYKHYLFNESTDPALVETALKVHAEGYTAMGFVSEDAVDPNGVLDSSIDHSRGVFTDYYLAVNPNDPNDMATVRKISTPLYGSFEDLPAFQLSKDVLYPEGIALLNELEANGYQIKEIAGLARTKSANPMSVYELIREVFQTSIIRDEAWFFSIVSSTFNSITQYFGKTAFRVIGQDVRINDYRVNEKIQLKPSILVPNQSFKLLIEDINNTTTPKAKRRLLSMFLYLSENLGEDIVGHEVFDFRNRHLSELELVEQ